MQRGVLPIRCLMPPHPHRFFYFDRHRAAVAVAIDDAGEGVHRRVAQEQVKHRLFQRGAVVMRAVASFAVHDHPAFGAAVFAFVQHVAEVAQRFVHEETVQVNFARNRQASGTQRMKARVGDGGEVVPRFLRGGGVSNTLRFNAAAL